MLSFACAQFVVLYTLVEIKITRIHCFTLCSQSRLYNYLEFTYRVTLNVFCFSILDEVMDPFTSEGESAKRAVAKYICKCKFMTLKNEVELCFEKKNLATVEFI